MNLLSLFQIELIKTSRRAAYWVAAGVFTLFAVLLLTVILRVTDGVNINNQRVGLELPQSWSQMLDVFKQFSKIYLPITVIILAASEFTFKTARQNVIDGLSKEAFFTSKVILLLYSALTYFFIFFITVLIFGYIGTEKKENAEALIRASEWQLFGMYFIVLVGYGAIALFFAFVTRSSGSGLAFALLYTLIIENLLGLAMGLSDTLKSFVKYLPTKVLDELLNPLRYDNDKLTTLKENIEKAKEAGQTIPDQVMQMLPANETPQALVLALLYIAALLGATYLIFKRRDL